MSYLVSTPITYAAWPVTEGYLPEDHTLEWSFDDDTTDTGLTVVKTWTTIGDHTTSVLATNNVTGKSGTAEYITTIEDPV